MKKKRDFAEAAFAAGDEAFRLGDLLSASDAYWRLYRLEPDNETVKDKLADLIKKVREKCAAEDQNSTPVNATAGGALAWIQRIWRTTR